MKKLPKRPKLKTFKTLKRDIRSMQKAGRKLKKALHPKKLLPKWLRRMKKLHKVMKFVQKHQDTYTKGIYALVYGSGRLAKK